MGPTTVYAATDEQLRVDVAEVVRLLLAGEVEVRLLVELRDEPVRVLAQRIELPLSQRVRHGAA